MFTVDELYISWLNTYEIAQRNGVICVNSLCQNFGKGFHITHLLGSFGTPRKSHNETELASVSTLYVHSSSSRGFGGFARVAVGARANRKTTLKPNHMLSDLSSRSSGFWGCDRWA